MSPRTSASRPRTNGRPRNYGAVPITVTRSPAAALLVRLDVAPLPDRVKAALLDMIAAGGFADGRLPREEVLALELGVSREHVDARHTETPAVKPGGRP
jgi:hypothetical protein